MLIINQSIYKYANSYGVRLSICETTWDLETIDEKLVVLHISCVTKSDLTDYFIHTIYVQTNDTYIEDKRENLYLEPAFK